MDRKTLRARLVAAHGNAWRDELLLELGAMLINNHELDLDKLAPSVLTRWPCNLHDPPRRLGPQRIPCAVCRRAAQERDRLVAVAGGAA